MKIAIVSHNFARNSGGGQARVNYELARHCLSEGITVHVISQKIDRDLLDAGALWRPIVPKPAKPQIASNWSFARQADRLIDQLRPSVDVTVGNGFVARARLDVSVCHMLHSAFLKSPFFPWRAKLNMGLNGWYQAVYTRANCRWEQQSYAAADVVVAVSEKVSRELHDIGLPPRKVRVIHNGVDSAEFRPGQVDRAKWNLPADKPLAFFAGGIKNSLRNLDTILHALAGAPGVHLAVAGDDRGSPYPALAERLGVGDRVHFLGYRGDVAELMRAADFFVYPSRYEACSLVLLEAISSGLPVITARSAGGSELLNDACAFVLDNPHDVQTLSRRIRELATDAGLRARMAAAARATALELSWSRMAAQYVKLFEACCLRKATPSAARHAAIAEPIASPTVATVKPEPALNLP